MLLLISPLIVFDLRHEFININNILSDTHKPGEDNYFFLFKLLSNLRIQFENLTSLFAAYKYGVIMAGASLWIFLRLASRSKKETLAIWILTPVVLFSFYDRHIPEYYFLSSFPAFIIMLAIVINRLSKKFRPSLIYFLLFAVILVNLYQIQHNENLYSLLYKQQTVSYIRENFGDRAFISFDTDLGMQAGFKYLFKKSNIKLADSANPPTHTIVIPPERRISEEYEIIFGGIKVIESPSVFE
jgi:hypothetical protein